MDVLEPMDALLAHQKERLDRVESALRGDVVDSTRLSQPDSKRTTRAEIFRMQCGVGQNAKESRDIVARLRCESIGGEPAKYQNPLPHWHARRSLDKDSVLGLGLSETELEKMGVGRSVPGEFDIMQVAEEYGIRERADAQRQAAENPPPEPRHSQGARPASWRALAAPWPSSAYEEVEPVSVAAVEENLKLASRLRELERRCKQLEEEAVLSKDARRRTEDEHARISRQLEQQVQELTSKLIARAQRKAEHAAATSLLSEDTAAAAAASSRDAPVGAHAAFVAAGFRKEADGTSKAGHGSGGGAGGEHQIRHLMAEVRRLHILRLN